MIEISNSQINTINIENGMPTKIEVGNTQVWPTNSDYTYKLQDLVVTYSDSSGALHPNCNNYVQLTASLYTYLGTQQQGNPETVTVIPEIQSTSRTTKEGINVNNLFVVNVTTKKITADSSKKETEYNSNSTPNTLYATFKGKYDINGTTYYVTEGTTETSVLILGNSKTVTQASETTTGIKKPVVTVGIEGNELEAYAEPGQQLTATVTCTRVYKSVTQKTEFTSGIVSGGVETTGLTQSVNAESINISPTTGILSTVSNGVINGNTIIVGTNNSDQRRSWTISANYGGFSTTSATYSERTCTLYQAANQYIYSDITNVSILYENIIPAKGGSSEGVTPSVTFTQTYGWAPNNNTWTADTTGLTYLYEKNTGSGSGEGGTLVSTSTGEVTASSMGSTPYNPISGTNGGESITYGRIVAQVKVKVTCHNKTSAWSSYANVYQGPNVVTTSAVVTLLNTSNQTITSHTFPSAGGTDNILTFKAKSVRTSSYTSEYPAQTETIENDVSKFSISKSGGSWITSAIKDTSSNTFKVQVSENTGDEQRTGGTVTVSDSSYSSGYGTKYISLSQSSASYAMDGEGYTDTNINLSSYGAYTSTSPILITFEATRNGKAYSNAFTTSSVTISSVTGSNPINGLTCIGFVQGEGGESEKYTAKFTCNANDITSNRVSKITINQKNASGSVVNSLTYTVTHAAYITSTIEFIPNTKYIILDTTTNSTTTFQLKCNKNWKFVTYNNRYCTSLSNQGFYKVSDFNDNWTGKQNPITVRTTQGNNTQGSSTGNSYIGITVTRQSYDSDYPFVQIVIAYGDNVDSSNPTTTTILVVPPFDFSTLQTTTWQPTASANEITAISFGNNYPSNYITNSWSVSPTSTTWLHGSGTKISVDANTSTSSTRSASITASVSVNDIDVLGFTTFPDDNDNNFKKTATISVTQQKAVAPPAFESVKYANYGSSTFSTITSFPKLIKTWSADTIGLSNGIVMRVFVNSSTTKLVSEISGGNNILLSSTASSPTQGQTITFTSFTTSSDGRYAQFTVYPDKANTTSSTVTYTLTLTLNDNTSITRTMTFKQSGTSTPYNGVGSWDSI